MTEPRAAHQGIPTENTADFADYVRSELKKVGTVIDNVVQYALDNHLLDGYLSEIDVNLTGAEAEKRLVELNNILVKLAFGDRTDKLLSRKEFKAENNLE